MIILKGWPYQWIVDHKTGIFLKYIDHYFYKKKKSEDRFGVTASTEEIYKINFIVGKSSYSNLNLCNRFSIIFVLQLNTK